MTTTSAASATIHDRPLSVLDVPPLYSGNVFEPGGAAPPQAGHFQAACAEVIAAAQGDAAAAAVLAQHHAALRAALATPSADFARQLRAEVSGGARLASVELPARGTSGLAIGAVGAQWLLLVRAGARAAALVRVADGGVEVGAAPAQIALEGALVGEVAVAPEALGTVVAGELVNDARLLLHAAFLYGVASSFLLRGLRFLKEEARAWREAPSSVASEDPLTLERVGGYVARAHALELLVAHAAATADAEPAGLAQAGEGGSLHLAPAASAYRYASRFAPELANGLIEVLGAGSTDRRSDLDRPWREIQAYRSLDHPIAD